MHANVRRAYQRVVRKLCLYRQRTEPDCFVPDASRFPQRRPSRTPVILGPADIARLLNATDELRIHGAVPLRSAMLRLAVVLLLDNKTVLEIGCGDGRISKLFTKITDNLIGIDPEEKKIKAAQVNIPKGKFLIGSGGNLVFSNEYFDFVIFTLSLRHQDSRKALK
ncbi:MAG: class I SAM-dependent methyltransferase [Gammaproteobacteria bacterium]|nr:class I SAM-dependent methyltransferase [Gammaproteobacteria bacterium]